MNFECESCGDELEEPGGLLFSPPDEHGRCLKEHLCKDCWAGLHHEIQAVRRKRRNDGD